MIRFFRFCKLRCHWCWLLVSRTVRRPARRHASSSNGHGWPTPNGHQHLARSLTARIVVPVDNRARAFRPALPASMWVAAMSPKSCHTVFDDLSARQEGACTNDHERQLDRRRGRCHRELRRRRIASAPRGFAAHRVGRDSTGRRRSCLSGHVEFGSSAHDRQLPIAMHPAR
jgi:hypothetical protein